MESLQTSDIKNHANYQNLPKCLENIINWTSPKKGARGYRIKFKRYRFDHEETPELQVSKKSQGNIKI